jgi:hypothetical protein
MFVGGLLCIFSVLERSGRLKKSLNHEGHEEHEEKQVCWPSARKMFVGGVLERSGRLKKSLNHEGHEEHEAGLQDETLDAILELRDVEIEAGG